MLRPRPPRPRFRELAAGPAVIDSIEVWMVRTPEGRAGSVSGVPLLGIAILGRGIPVTDAAGAAFSTAVKSASQAFN